MKKSKKFTRFVVVAMLCAVSFVLYLLEFPLFPGAGHLKLDLSDIPALVGAMLFGPVWGVVIELVKNLIELAVKGMGTQMGFGNLMNFIVGTAYIVPFCLLYKRSRKKSGVVFAAVVGIASIVLVGIGANYLIDPPFFKYFLGVTLESKALWGAIWSATALNAIKGAMLSVLGFVLVPTLIKRIDAQKFV